MATNTIKLSSGEGDKYISPTQTLVYKNVTLFGYGYLDWGTIVNQSIINLMDAIDNLNTNGLSQIQFDLTEYEENQKRLRAEEFNTWKTGFKSVLTDLVQTYIDETVKTINDFKTTQTQTNADLSKLIAENFTLLDEEINSISNTLDEKILTTVQDQVSSLSNTLDTLTSKVNSAHTSLTEATSNVNKVLTEAQNLISNFKNEFNNTFEMFKNETNDALTTNKDAIIEYIDTLINKSNLVTSNLDERLTSLELVSDSLNPDTIRTIIINKVNELAGGIIASALSTYEGRLDTLDNEIAGINNNLPLIISEKVNLAMETISSQIESFNQALVSLNRSVVTINNTLSPIEQMRVDIVAKFGTVPDMIHQILDQMETISELMISSGSIAKEHKNSIKNMVENIIAQEVKNNENMIAYINSIILNLLDGFSITAFDELSLIKRSSTKNTLFDNLTSTIKDNVNIYNVDELKYVGLEANYVEKTLSFAFKLPKTLINPANIWKSFKAEFINITTGETIETLFDVIDSPMNLAHKTKVNNLPIIGNIPTNKVTTFNYVYDWNASTLITINWDSLSSSDTFKLVIRETDDTLLLSSQVLLSDTTYIDIDDHYKNVVYPTLYKVNETITKPTPNIQNITWVNTNDKVLIPVCQIQSKPDLTKVLALKIKLPNNATLTSIDFSDGISSYTKTFVNQNTFPLTEAEYTSRNLSSTNNYYKDICSTGLLYYTINNDAKKVTGVITYVINGVTKTYDISTTSSGGGSETHIQDSTISSGSYIEYSMATLFGAGTDANTIMVEVRVLETNTTSDVYNKYLKADHLTSVVWMDSDIIRIYNEYNTNLTFRTIFKS